MYQAQFPLWRKFINNVSTISVRPFEIEYRTALKTAFDTEILLRTRYEKVPIRNETRDSCRDQGHTIISTTSSSVEFDRDSSRRAAIFISVRASIAILYTFFFFFFLSYNEYIIVHDIIVAAAL